MLKNMTITIGILFALTVAGNSATAAQTKKKIKSNITTASTPFHKIQLLTIEQMAALHPNARLQYVKYLRESFRDLETLQNAFKEKMVASLTPKQKELFAILFLGHAYADEDVNYRGGEGDDRCIYAYNLFNYMPDKNGKPIRNPFGCQKPAACAKGSVTCNFIISGLSGSAGCISENPPYTSTVRCDDQRKQQNTKNNSSIQVVVKAVQDYFKPEADGKISPDKMNSEDGRAKLAALLPYMYNDEVYSEFIGVYMLYRKAGISLALPEPYKSLGIERIDTEHATIADTINKIFAGHVRHCQNDLAPDLIASIADESKWTEAKLQSAANRDEQRKIKQNLLDFQKQNPGKTPEVGDVLQVDECRLTFERLNALRQAADRAQGSLPIEVAGSDRRVSKTTGCSSIITSHEDNVIDESALCLICAAEKAVQNTADDRIASRAPESAAAIQRMLDGNRRTQGVETYTVSRKWVNLLATMAQGCGRGDANFVPEKVMQEMIQSYGHCHSEIFDWPATMREFDYNKIEEWARNNQWNDMVNLGGLGKNHKPLLIDKYGKKVPRADEMGEFARIYGVSYSEATALFCDPANFDAKKGRTKLASKIESQKGRFTESEDPVSEKARADGANARMAKLAALAKKDDKSNQMRTAFLECAQKSKIVADELYYEGSVACSGIKSVQNRTGRGRSVNDVLLDEVVNETLPNPGNAVFASGRCDVARQVEISKAGKEVRLAETLVADREYTNGKPSLPVTLFSSNQTVNVDKGSSNPTITAESTYLARDPNSCYDVKVVPKSGDKLRKSGENK